MVERSILLRAKIMSSTKGYPVFFGEFTYTYNDLMMNALNITLDDVCGFAFGNFFDRKPLCDGLKSLASANPDKELKLVIDGVNLENGRDIAAPDPVITVLPLYFVLDASGQGTDLEGNVIFKIRQLQKLRLTNEQVDLLKDRGFDVVLTSSISLTQFINSFSEPIAWVGTQDIINGQPITVFADGSTSFQNDGVFTTQQVKDTTNPNDYTGIIIREQSVFNDEQSKKQQTTSQTGLGKVLLAGGLVVIAT